MGTQLVVTFSFLCWLLFEVNALQETSGERLVVMPSGHVINRKEGEQLTLTCSPGHGVDISHVHNLTWRRDNNLFPASSTQLALTNKIQLRFTAPTEADSGLYSCHGTVDEKPVNVQRKVIFHNPAIHWTCPQTQQLTQKTVTFIECSARSNSAPIKLTWSKDDVQIKFPNKAYDVQEKGLRFVKNLSQEDVGQFKASATIEELGETSDKLISVTVLEHPLIVNWLSLYEEPEGAQVTFYCSARGVPAPTYTWDLPENLGRDFVEGIEIDTKLGSLFIQNASFEYNGSYICNANNVVGSDKRTAELSLVKKPVINSFPDNVTEEGSNIALTCEVNGSAEVSIHRKGFPIPLDHKWFRLSDQRRASGSYLTISANSLNRQDDGLYECVAKNKGGTTFREARVSVEFKPVVSSPDDVLYAWTGHPVNLTCSAEAKPFDKFSWSHRATNGSLVTLSPTDTIFTWLGLDMYQSHLLVDPSSDGFGYGSYVCVANNERGAVNVTIEVREALKPGLVENVTIISVAQKQIKFRVDFPPNDEGSPISYYHVSLNSTGAKTSPTIKYNANAFSNEVDGLFPDTNYTLRFMAENAVGSGNWSEPIYVKTLSPLPVKPKFLLPPDCDPMSGELTATGGKLNISWEQPPNGSNILYYNITYYRVNRNEEWRRSEGPEIRVTLVDCPTDYLITDLESGVYYMVGITAINGSGSSPPAHLTFYSKPATESIGLLFIFVAIAIPTLILALVIVDLTCCYPKKKGVIRSCRYKCSRSRSHDIQKRSIASSGDTKNGAYVADKEELLNNKASPTVATVNSSHLRGSMDGKLSCALNQSPLI